MRFSKPADITKNDFQIVKFMLNKEDKKKVERYINGTADDSEKDFVESLFYSGENNEVFKELIGHNWNEFKVTNSKSPDLSYILDKIHHTINIAANESRPTLISKMARFYARIAAILLIPLLAWWGFLMIDRSSQDDKVITSEAAVSTEIYAPYGSRVSFNLPDGTTGMLNSGSSLSYTLPFSDNRNITLRGEGWFEVAHDEQHPFTINSGSSSVVVLGTSFNMSAYPNENYVEVVLAEGKVRFNDDQIGREIIMDPSERLVYKDGNVEESVVDATKYNSWTEGKLVFRGDPMEEVARRIERWYNVKVILADEQLKDYSFRATFEDDSLDDVFRFLSMTTPITYKITPRYLMPDSTWSKEIVTVYMNMNK